MNEIFTLINLLILIANVGLTIITVKLYSEVFKDRKIDQRQKAQFILKGKRSE